MNRGMEYYLLFCTMNIDKSMLFVLDSYNLCEITI